jgi:cytochrome c biogenesis protein CcmG, thiol:disulfide interchange protein DsbE
VGSTSRFRSLALATVVVFVLAGCGSEPSLPAGVAAAEGNAPAIDDATLGGGTLPDLSGQVLVVNFWNPYCGPCRVEAPVLEAASRQYASRGVTVVGVHYTGEQWPKSVDDALSFVDAAHVTYPVVPDPGADLATGFGIRGIPSTVIVDASGEMRFRVLGAVKAMVLDDLLGRVLEGTPTP